MYVFVPNKFGNPEQFSARGSHKSIGARAVGANQISATNLQWTNPEGDLTVTAKAMGHGRCCLECRFEDVQVTICSSIKAFRCASLGPRCHFASTDGACEIMQKEETVTLKVQQWRGPSAVIEIDRDTFLIGLQNLEQIEAVPQKEIKLL